MFSRPAFLLLSVFALVSGLMGGCSQRMAVEGTREQLVAEAKGALLSEGFHPVGRGGAVAGTEGSNPRAGRLEFLYYCDTMSPTVVEIQISPNTAAGPAGGMAVAANGTAASNEPAGFLGAHQVIVKAWSSMTFAPDPFIADLAMGVLRRAYMLSGNTP